MLKHTLKVKPLSANRCWKGRRFKTQEYNDYELECSLLLPKKKVHGPVKVTFHYHLKNAKISDIDNPCKPLLDILVKNEIIDDDRHIWELSQKKYLSDDNYIEIEIEEGKMLTDKSVHNTK